MTKTPKTLYAEADEQGGKLVWSLDDKKPTKKGDKKTIHFPKNTGEYDVTIMFTDNTKRGIIFNTVSPLYVQEGGQCPPQSGINSTEIPSNSIVAGADSLQFTNCNQKDCRLVYQLNFIDSKNRDLALDPDFKNGGTGGRGLSAAAKVAIIAGATALVVVLAVTSMGETGQ
jgi:hypothetical protein